MGNVNQYVALGQNRLILESVRDGTAFVSRDFECAHAHDGTPFVNQCFASDVQGKRTAFVVRFSDMLVTEQTTHSRSRIPVAPRRHQTLRRDSLLVTALVLLVVGVATLGKSFIEIPGVVNASAHAVRSLDLQMFNGFDHPTIWYGPWTNTIGNFLLFMPLGASLIVMGQNLRRVRFGLGGTILAGLALSLSIETLQYLFALGFSDVDDLVFNTLGTAVGAFFLARISKELQSKVLHRMGFIAATALTVLGCAIATGIIA